MILENTKEKERKKCEKRKSKKVVKKGQSKKRKNRKIKCYQNEEDENGKENDPIQKELSR